MSRPGTNFTISPQFHQSILATFRELHPHLWPAEALNIRIGIDFDQDVETETKE